MIGTAKAGTGVGATKLGTIKRADGTMQATYGGHALYEHAKDATGAATGEGTNNNWFAVSPAGTQATEHDPHNHVRTTPAVHKRCRSGLAGIAGVDRLLMAG